ncbi:MAG: hypothetical protein ACPGCK_05335, partial [Flavobacteriaceae bacterium]
GKGTISSIKNMMTFIKNIPADASGIWMGCQLIHDSCDHNQRMIVLGNKLNAIAEKYFQDNKKRPLISNLLQLVEGENAKRKRKSASVAKKEREDKKKLQVEMEKAIAPIRKAKKKAKKAPPPPPPKPKVNFKCGDRVRIKDSRSVGRIDTIEKNKAIVNYGLFTTQVSVDQLELVQ